MNATILSLVSQSGLGLILGALAGTVHFGSLWWNARLFAAPGSMAKAFVIQIGRFAVLVAVFALLSRLGALPLLSGALGLLIARQVVMKRLGALG